MTNIQRTIGRLPLMLAWMIILSGCRDNGERTTTLTLAYNYILLLDLSDRVLDRETVQADTAVIHSVFTEFEDKVRKQLYIRSRDIFAIRLAPQKDGNIDRNHYENVLSLDMSRLGTGTKHARFKEFSDACQIAVAGLYSDALQGRSKSSDFFGCDIWRYFNEQLEMDLKPGYRNIVIVLTDGYFDFEDSMHSMQKGNRYTCSDFYYRLTGPKWKEVAIVMDYGLIPVDIQIPFSCHVCGLRPKSNQLTELEKLGYFWTKWVLESGCDTVGLIPLTSTEKMKSHLLLQLNSY